MPPVDSQDAQDEEIQNEDESLDGRHRPEYPSDGKPINHAVPLSCKSMQAAPTRRMKTTDLQALLEDVRRGAVSPAAAHEHVLQFLRQAPFFEDLGFAQHRPPSCPAPGLPRKSSSARQDACSDRGRNRRPHRRPRPEPPRHPRDRGETFDAVRRASARVVHDTARAITLRQDDVPPGRGHRRDRRCWHLGPAGRRGGRGHGRRHGQRGRSSTTSASPASIGCSRSRSRLAAARVVIVVAGMEGALPSVVGGLVEVPVIACRRASATGELRRLAASRHAERVRNGVVVVNIDNGFGAAAIASRHQPCHNLSRPALPIRRG